MHLYFSQSSTEVVGVNCWEYYNNSCIVHHKSDYNFGLKDDMDFIQLLSYSLR
jgi:hypothetical protein